MGRPSIPVRLFIHIILINIVSVLSPRHLLPTLALVSLRSHTRSSWLHCRFPLYLLTQYSEAFRSSFSLIMLEQLDHLASTAGRARCRSQSRCPHPNNGSNWFPRSAGGTARCGTGDRPGGCPRR